MPHLAKLTPNLVVRDVEASIRFYRDVLGFAVTRTVPEAAPFVFASVESGGVEVFFNAEQAAFDEYPALKAHPIGGTLTLFIEVKDIRALHDALKSRVTIVMPLEKKWYGVTEFAFVDPDGYILTYAEIESA